MALHYNTAGKWAVPEEAEECYNQAKLIWRKNMLDFMRKYAAHIVWVIVLAFALSLGIFSCSGREQRQGTRGRPPSANAIAAIDGKEIDARLFVHFYNIGLMNFHDPQQTDLIDPMLDASIS